MELDGERHGIIIVNAFNGFIVCVYKADCAVFYTVFIDCITVVLTCYLSALTAGFAHRLIHAAVTVF